MAHTLRGKLFYFNFFFGGGDEYGQLGFRFAGYFGDSRRGPRRSSPSCLPRWLQGLLGSHTQPSAVNLPADVGEAPVVLGPK